jgi:hypothetical protein
MRDLYNGNKKLDYWTDRMHKDLDEYDKKDVLKFLEIMQEKDQSILTITRCISIVIQIRKQIDKPLSEVQKMISNQFFGEWTTIDKNCLKTLSDIVVRKIFKQFFFHYCLFNICYSINVLYSIGNIHRSLKSIT